MAQGEVAGGKGTTWLALSIGDFAYKNNRKTVRGFKETERVLRKSALLRGLNFAKVWRTDSEWVRGEAGRCLGKQDRHSEEGMMAAWAGREDQEGCIWRKALGGTESKGPGGRLAVGNQGERCQG